MTKIFFKYSSMPLKIYSALEVRNVEMKDSCIYT